MKTQRKPPEHETEQRWALWVQAGVLLGVTVAAGVTTLLIG
ncbi:MAG: hypothetical protein VX899_17865 [Myxococcota bacterium]|nr:hypothetical protein [Myxococcota bacterium]